MSADVRGDDEVVSDQERPRPQTVSEKLTRLFEVLHPPGGRELSTREVARRVKAQGGSISPSYISELKSGKKTNPSLEQVKWLAAAFGVSAGYFTDDEVADRVDAELDQLAELQQAKPELVEIAEMQVTLNMRTADLDESDQAALTEMVQAFWRRRKQRRL